MIGRGGGGHGGGSHHHGGGGYGWVGPWGYDAEELEAELEQRRRISGQELLSTGEGAILVLGLLWWLTHEADKRVPR